MSMLRTGEKPVTDPEIEQFREYIAGLDASFDEYKMLIAMMVTEAGKEYLNGFLEHLKNEGPL